MKLLLLAFLLAQCVPVPNQKDTQACCDSMLLTTSTNPFTDARRDQILMDGGDDRIIAVVYENQDNIALLWMFPETEPPVFIIDEEHKSLPGKVRFGKLPAKDVRWIVRKTTGLAINVTFKEYLALRDGLTVRVENTWMEPSYQQTLDLSCPAAWKLLDERRK